MKKSLNNTKTMKKLLKKVKTMNFMEFEVFLHDSIYMHIDEAEKNIMQALKEKYGFGAKRQEVVKKAAREINERKHK